MTPRFDQVKIDVLQKGLKMRWEFDHFFNRGPKLLHFKT